MKYLGKKRWKWMIAIFLIITTLLVFCQPKTWPAWLLVRNDRLSKSDAIIVLMGNTRMRTPYAAQLYHEGWAPQIVFAQVAPSDFDRKGYTINDGDLTVKLLGDLAVPRSAINYLSSAEVTSTRDEAEALLKQLPDAKRVIIVTDWYHTSRAGWIFSRYAPEQLEILVSAAMLPTHNPDVWIHYEEPFIATIVEYIKWFYYLWHY